MKSAKNSFRDFIFLPAVNESASINTASGLAQTTMHPSGEQEQYRMELADWEGEGGSLTNLALNKGGK